MQCPRCQQENLTSHKCCRDCGTSLGRLEGGAQPALSYAELQRSLAEALEQQAATAEILRVISSSPTDLQPILDTVAERAARLCEAYDAEIFRREGDRLLLVAHHGPIPSGLIHEFTVPIVRGTFISRGWVTGRAVVDRRTIHVHDLAAESDTEYPVGKAAQRQTGHRTTLATPLLREGVPLGVISIRRMEVRPFSKKHVRLLETFADQAVIAIENVRLFKELEARNLDLSEALEQQTATSEILRVISSSPTDLQPVFDIIAESAVKLCDAEVATVTRFDGEWVHLGAIYGSSRAGMDALRQTFPMRPSAAGGAARAVRDRAIVHIPDVLTDQEYLIQETALTAGFRAILGVPMLRDGRAIGAITLGRANIGKFGDTQIQLLRTFADQAVIAVENVRLFNELQERTHELTRSVDELRALGAVGQAVSSSLDLETVLNTVIARAVEISAAHGGIIYEYDEAKQEFHLIRGSHRLDEELGQVIRAAPIRLGEGVAGKAAELRAPVQVPDILDEQTYDVVRIRAVFEKRGYRSLLAVPLLLEHRIIGVLVVWRQEAGRFVQDIVNLLQTFASQSVLAIQNARLFREIDEKSRALEKLSRNQEQLSRLATVLQEPLSLTEQLTRVLDAARQVVGLDRIYIWTLSPRTDGLMVTAQAGFEESEWHDLVGVTIPIGEAGALTAVCRDSTPLLFTEKSPLPAEYRLRPPYAALAGLRVKNFLVIPMIARGRTVGVLAADNRVSRTPIPAHTVDLLQTFAAQAAVAVENGHLFREIEDKGRQLEAASRHKSEFLANMSHELRTPLNAVIGFSEVLLQRMFGALNDKQDEYLKDIYASGQHLLSLINDILDLSKIEAGRMELVPAPFHLPTALENAVTLVRERAGRHGIALHLDLDPRLDQLVGDERKVKQVLLNLLSNAVKFTPEGGRISLKAGLADGAVEMSVTDTGIGIAPEDQAAIFEEFRQVGSDETRKQEGTGLGLTLAKKFIELHGGRIWVKSELGRGSTFTFTLPVS